MLYRYRQFDHYSLANLAKSQLWCSALQAFNDPYEAQFELEVRQPGELDDLYDHWRQMFPDRPIYRKTIRFDALDILKASRSWYGVCCFSETCNSPQMWGYYGASHTGFCLGFDFPGDTDDGTVNAINIHKVKYRREPVRFPVAEFLKDQKSVHHSLRKIATIKHTHWKHEKEWRLISDHPNKEVPYQPTSLREILIGAKAEAANIERLQQVCRSLPGDIRVRQFVLMHGTYELRFADEIDIPDIG
jgi:hypothetical protein